jgi:hypothetical protein
VTLDPSAVAVVTPAAAGESPRAGAEPAIMTPSVTPSARNSAWRRIRVTVRNAVLAPRDSRNKGGLLTGFPFLGKLSGPHLHAEPKGKGAGGLRGRPFSASWALAIWAGKVSYRVPSGIGVETPARL